MVSYTKVAAVILQIWQAGGAWIQAPCSSPENLGWVSQSLWREDHGIIYFIKETGDLKCWESFFHRARRGAELPVNGQRTWLWSILRTGTTCSAFFVTYPRPHTSSIICRKDAFSLRQCVARPSQSTLGRWRKCLSLPFENWYLGWKVNYGF